MEQGSSKRQKIAYEATSVASLLKAVIASFSHLYKEAAAENQEYRAKSN